MCLSPYSHDVQFPHELLREMTMSRTPANSNSCKVSSQRRSMTLLPSEVYIIAWKLEKSALECSEPGEIVTTMLRLTGRNPSSWRNSHDFQLPSLLMHRHRSTLPAPVIELSAPSGVWEKSVEVTMYCDAASCRQWTLDPLHWSPPRLQRSVDWAWARASTP